MDVCAWMYVHGCYTGMSEISSFTESVALVPVDDSYEPCDPTQLLLCIHGDMSNSTQEYKKKHTPYKKHYPLDKKKYARFEKYYRCETKNWR